MEFKVSKYVIISDPIGPGNELTSKRMIFSTRKGMGITITNYLMSILQAGQFDSIPDHMFNILMYHEILVPAEEDEFDEVLQKKIAFTSDIELTEININIDSKTPLDNEFLRTINNEINERVATQGNRAPRIRVTLDITATDPDTLVSLYKQAADFYCQHTFACNAKVDCTLRGVFGESVNRIALEEGLIPISKLQFLIDSSDASVEASHIQRLADFFVNAQKYKSKTDIQLLINSSRLDIIEKLRDELLSFTNDRKNSIRIVPVNSVNKIADHKTELDLLNRLAELGLHFDFLSVPDNKYRVNDAVSTDAGQLLSHRLEGKINLVRKNYDDHIVRELSAKKTKCFSCVYLPMCGGKLNKNDHHNDDCPEFTYNFMKKAGLKYGITLQ